MCLLFVFFLLYAGIYKRKKVEKVLFVPAASEKQYMQHGHGNHFGFDKISFIMNQ